MSRFRRAVFAAALAGGCGTASPTRAGPRSGPATVAPVPGTDVACERLLGDGADTRPAGLRALHLNPALPRLVCVAELGVGEANELVILLAGRDAAGGWVELSRESAPLASTSDGEVTESETAEVGDIEIAAGEKALVLTRTKQREGPQFSDTTETVSILRATGVAFDEVFTVSSETTTGEADKKDVATFAVTDKVTAGFYDIEVTRQRSSAQWAAGEGLIEEEPEVTRHVFDGRRYVDAGPMP